MNTLYHRYYFPLPPRICLSLSLTHFFSLFHSLEKLISNFSSISSITLFRKNALGVLNKYCEKYVDNLICYCTLLGYMYVVRYLINWTLKVEAKPENGRPKDDKKIPNASEKVVEKLWSTEILFSISFAARSRFLFIGYIKLYFFPSLHGSLESSANKSIRKNVFF